VRVPFVSIENLKLFDLGKNFLGSCGFPMGICGAIYFGSPKFDV